MSDYGHLRYVSDHGIASIGDVYVATGIVTAIIPALMDGTAPPPESVIILAGEQRNIWQMGAREFVAQSHMRELDVDHEVMLENLMAYLARVPRGNILWQEDETRLVQGLADRRGRNRVKLRAHYQFLAELGIAGDEQFTRYLIRFDQFIAALGNLGVGEPALIGRHSGHFTPLDYRLVWSGMNVEWACAYPYRINRMLLLLEDLPDLPAKVRRRVGQGDPLLPLFVEQEVVQLPTISRVEILID